MAVVARDISAGSSVLLSTLWSSSSLLSDRPTSSFLSASVATTLVSSSSLLPFGFAVTPVAPVSSALLRSSLAFLLLGFGFAGGSFSTFCGSVSYLLLPLPPCFVVLRLALQVFLFFFFRARSSFWCSSPFFASACFFLLFLLLALPCSFSA